MIGSSLRVCQSRAFFLKGTGPLPLTKSGALVNSPPTPVELRWKLNIESSKVDYTLIYFVNGLFDFCAFSRDVIAAPNDIASSYVRKKRKKTALQPCATMFS